MPNADIFISYRRDQREQVVLIADKLAELGLSVWFDARLEAGTSFDEEINREVRSAKAVLVCWSPEAIQSRWVRAEASIGLERDVLVATFLRPTELITPYNLVHTVSLEGWSGAQDAASWRDLLARIGGLVGRPNLSDEAMAKALDGEWAERDQEVRASFRSKIDEARRRFAALRENQPAAFEQGLRDMTTAFESWILRRRVNSVGDAPDPLELVDDQTEALRLDLATARRERDAVAAVAARSRGSQRAASANADASPGAPRPRATWRALLDYVSLFLFGPFALNATQRRGLLHLYLGVWAIALAALITVVLAPLLSPSYTEAPATEAASTPYGDAWGGCYSSTRQAWFLDAYGIHYEAAPPEPPPPIADSNLPPSMEATTAPPPESARRFATREELIAHVRAARVAEAELYNYQFVEPTPEPAPASPQEAFARQLRDSCEHALGEQTGYNEGQSIGYSQGYSGGVRSGPNSLETVAAIAVYLLIALNVVSLLLVLTIGAYQRRRARPKAAKAAAR